MYWIEGKAGFVTLVFMGFGFSGYNKARVFNRAKRFIRQQQRAASLWEECRRAA